MIPLDDYDKTKLRKISNAFEIAGKKGYPPITFTSLWLLSDVNKRLIAGDSKDIYMGDLYQVNTFLMEMEAKNIPIEPREGQDYIDYSDLLFWAGEVLTYWQLTEGITGREIVENYDIGWILNSYTAFCPPFSEESIHNIKENCPKEWEPDYE